MDSSPKIDLAIALTGIIMFAYGVFVGDLEGSAGYISVLVCGIIVFALLIYRHYTKWVVSEWF